MITVLSLDTDCAMTDCTLVSISSRKTSSETTSHTLRPTDRRRGTQYDVIILSRFVVGDIICCVIVDKGNIVDIVAKI